MVLASRNKRKIVELRTLLSEYLDFEFELLSLDDIGFNEDIVEDGNSFEENALLKASVPARLGYIGIADDSGLEVDALDNAPGIYSARYAGEPCDDQANNDKLLKKLENVPDDKRCSHYVCVMAAAFPSGDSILARGECHGRILRSPIGEGGFGYDPLFYFEEFGTTFAAVPPEQKNGVSHRSNAIKIFAQKLNSYAENGKL